MYTSTSTTHTLHLYFVKLTASLAISTISWKFLFLFFSQFYYHHKNVRFSHIARTDFNFGSFVSVFIFEYLSRIHTNSFSSYTERNITKITSRLNRYCFDWMCDVDWIKKCLLYGSGNRIKCYRDDVTGIFPFVKQTSWLEWRADGLKKSEWII